MFIFTLIGRLLYGKDLKMDGMADVEPLFRCQQPFHWETVFDLISPR